MLQFTRQHKMTEIIEQVPLETAGKTPEINAFKKFALKHFAGFALYSSHFFPYSVFAYPAAAILNKLSARLDKVWKYHVFLAYLAAAFYFATNSYLFRYSYAININKYYFVTCILFGVWAFALSSFGKFKAAFLPAVALLALNLTAPASYPFAWRFHSGGNPVFSIILFLIISSIIFFKCGKRKSAEILFILCIVFFYTGNSPAPLIIGVGAIIAFHILIASDFAPDFHPLIHGFSTFNILLIFGMCQFYTLSLPMAMYKHFPHWVTPVFVYGNSGKNMPALAKRDNRFLSEDPLGRYLYFGARMSTPDLFRLNQKDFHDYESLTIDNTTDNIAMTSDGKWIFVGSTKRNFINKIAVAPFRFDRTVALPFRPIRLILDEKRSELYSIGEFGAGSLAVLDTNTLSIKRALPGKLEDQNIRDFALDSEDHKLIVIKWLDLVIYDSTTLKPLSSYRVSNKGLGRLAIDPVHNLVFLTCTNKGMILVFSYNNGHILLRSKLVLGPGLRDIAFDAFHNRIATVNYFNGNLYILNYPFNKRLISYNIGPRARSVEFSKQGNHLLSTSLFGGFVMDVSHPPSGTSSDPILNPHRFSVLKFIFPLYSDSI